MPHFVLPQRLEEISTATAVVKSQSCPAYTQYLGLQYTAET